MINWVQVSNLCTLVGGRHFHYCAIHAFPEQQSPSLSCLFAPIYLFRCFSAAQAYSLHHSSAWFVKWRRQECQGKLLKLIFISVVELELRVYAQRLLNAPRQNYKGFYVNSYATTCELEQFSIECRKTKTKVITPANHKGHRQSSEPIKTTKQIHVADVKRGKTCASESRLVLVLRLIGWESGVFFLANH